MLALRLSLSIFFSLFVVSTNQGHSEEFDLTTFGATYLKLENGMDIDDFAPRLSFFFNSHLDFF